MSAIKELKRHGITVKINCIVIPGINDTHVIEVAKTVKELGADLFNTMAIVITSYSIHYTKLYDSIAWNRYQFHDSPIQE